MPEQLSVTIHSLGARGDGLADADGIPVYVPDALPGEAVTVEVTERRKNGIHARLVSVDQASEHRQTPRCAHYQACGGCQLQHLDENLYRRWVRDRASFALSQHGFSNVVVSEPFITPPASRRRLAMKAVRTTAGVVLGFSEGGSHRVVNIEACPVAKPELQTLFAPLRQLLASVLSGGQMATLHLVVTDSGIDLLIEGPKELGLAERELCVAFADDHDIAAFHWQVEGFLDPLAIRREPIMNFAGAKVPVPPAAFMQATEESQKALTGAVVEACHGSKRVADLFCGLGTFTFPLARAHQVLAVEGARDALRALEAGRNGAQRQGVVFKQIVTRHRDLFRRPLAAEELIGFDAVVVDPPRAGAQAQMAELARSDVPKIVSVSCNPNTFARDARLLANGGYRLVSLLPVDQFLWSSHLELVGVFER